MAIRSWRRFGRSGTSPEREVPAAVGDTGAGGAARERRGSGDRCAPVLTGLRPRGLSIISVWQKTPTPARNLRRTATLSARFRPRNRPHRHH